MNAHNKSHSESGAQFTVEFPVPPVANHANNGYFEIVSLASYLPSTQKSTAQLIDETGLQLKDKIVIRATGVETRHIAKSAQADSDVLCIAAQKCLDEAKVSVNALSKIFVNKLLGDRILPPTSALLQRKLNSGIAVQCLDVDGGANGFLQAFLMAGRCLDGGDDTVLIASGGIHQQLMNSRDSRTAFLFGDAATALLLRASETRHLLAQYEFSNHSLQDFHHAVDFYHFVANYLNGGALELFDMGNLKEAESFYQHAAKHIMTVLLESAQCVADDIDIFCVSQMTLPIWQSIVSYLHLPDEKLISVLPHTGNTLAANIPLQLAAWQHRLGDLSHKKVMLISLGEGFLGGGCIYQF
ncbi:MAG: ketoacyl-ACP synthase III [Deltaproteobacteria bacterium]|nr:ketoacyl-ACP synthase III [Deltaproteobacteria bacterium]